MEKIKIESTEQVLSILREMTDNESVIAKIALGLKEINKPVSASYQEDYVTKEEVVEETSPLQIKEVKRQSNRRKKLKVTKEPKIVTLKDVSAKEKKSKKSETKKSELTEIHLF